MASIKVGLCDVKHWREFAMIFTMILNIKRVGFLAFNLDYASQIFTVSNHRAYLFCVLTHIELIQGQHSFYPVYIESQSDFDIHAGMSLV